MLILHPYLSTERPQDQQETNELVNILLDAGIGVVNREVDENEGYWKFLSEFWNWYDNATLLIIEHDNVPTIEQVRELATCPEPVCCIPYRLKNEHWSIGWIIEDDWDIQFVDKYYDPKKSMAANFPQLEIPAIDFSGFGFVKFGTIQKLIDISDYPGWRKATDQPISRHWSYMDWWFGSQLKKYDYEWHVHKGEVKHNHHETSS